MNQRSFVAVCGLVCITGTAEAGMPNVEFTISEAAKMRVETLSFFFGRLLSFCALHYVVMEQSSQGFHAPASA